MNMNDIIIKKKQGGKLTAEEIDFVVNGYVSEDIPDYQMSALLMAICFVGMDNEETSNLTNAMRYSGDNIDLSSISGIKVDKHSTGGVGDKTTFVVAPIAAACGVPIAKMSGRGLGFTGGTVDKMESIEGFKTALEPQEFLNQVNDIGISVIGQTGRITPADKKIYALRDVTGTVDNLSLIASSIMSKKLAAGSDKILLDVKCGNGAFMENLEEAKALGQIMCDIGSSSGRTTVAAITDMEQPLGCAVGNSLEVIEAIETLKGNGPADIEELSERLGGIMIYLGGRAKTIEEGAIFAKQAIASGAALEKMRQFIERQGGNPAVVDDYNLFPQPKTSLDLVAEEDGYISKIDARRIGMASQHTGAGRATKEDDIDLSAGIYLHKKVGDKVSKGQVIATLYGENLKKLESAIDEAKLAYEIGRDKVKTPELIKAILGI